MLFRSAHDVDEARRLLEADTSEELAREFAWSAADHGCPAIVELALKRLNWSSDDPRWHWILIQPIRGVDNDNAEPFLACMAMLLDRGVDANVTRMGQTVLHFAAARGGVSGPVRTRFASLLIDRGARLDVRGYIGVPLLGRTQTWIRVE